MEESGQSQALYTPSSIPMILAQNLTLLPITDGAALLGHDDHPPTNHYYIHLDHPELHGPHQ